MTETKSWFTQILKLDDDLSHKVRIAEQPGLLRNIAAFLGHSGDSWFWLAGLLVMIVISPVWRYLATVEFIAIFITATLVLGLKFTIRRQRPEGEWGQIYRKSDPHSFPSGHAARGLLIGVIALAIGPAWLGWLLIVWGPLVGIARVAMGVHYISDILGGWVVGLGMSSLTIFVVSTFF